MSILRKPRINEFWELEEVDVFQALAPATCVSATNGGTEIDVLASDPNSGADLSQYGYVIKRDIDGGSFFEVARITTAALETNFVDAMFSTGNATFAFPRQGGKVYTVTPDFPAIIAQTSVFTVVGFSENIVIDAQVLDPDGRVVVIPAGSEITVLSGTLTPTPVPAGHAFTYKIAPFNQFETASDSNAVTDAEPSAFVQIVLDPLSRTNNVISLSWTDVNAYATGNHIDIYRDLDGQGYELISRIVKTTGPMPTSYDDAFDNDKLVAGTYSYKVRSVSDVPHDNGPDSTIESLVVPALFVQPVMVSATVVNPSQIDLVWTDANSPVSEAQVRIDRQVGSDIFHELATVVPGTTTFSDMFPNDPGQTYVYRITPIGFVQAGPASDATTPQSRATAPLLAPTLTSVVQYADLGATIKWTDQNTHEDNYEVQRNLNGGGFSTVATLPGTATSYVDNFAISVGDSVVYRVRATNAYILGPFSNTLTLVIHAQLEAPTRVVPVIVDNKTIKVTWRSTSTLNRGVRVFRSIGGAPFGSEIATLPKGARSYVDSTPLAPLVPGQTYSYAIVDFDNAETGPQSQAGTLIVPLTTPLDLQITSMVGNVVTLDWTDNDAVFDLTLIEAAYGSGPFSVVGQVTKGVTTFVFSISGGGPLPSASFRIRETREPQIIFGSQLPQTFGDYSEIVMTNLTLVAPTALTVTRVKPSVNHLVWSDSNTDAQGFDIYISTSYGGLFTPYTLRRTIEDAAATSYDDAVISGTGLTFRYVILAFGGGTVSPISAPASILIRLGKTGVSAEQTNRTEMTVTVEAPVGYSFVAGDTLVITRSLNEGAATVVSSAPASFPFVYVDTAVAVGDTASYTAQLTSATQVSDLSDPATAKVEDAVFLPLGLARQVRIIGSRTTSVLNGIVAACVTGIVKVTTSGGNPVITSQSAPSVSDARSVVSGELSELLAFTGSAPGAGNIVLLDTGTLAVDQVQTGTVVFDAGDIVPGYVGIRPWSAVELRYNPLVASAQYAGSIASSYLGWALVEQRRGPIGTTNFNPITPQIGVTTWSATSGGIVRDHVQSAILNLVGTLPNPMRGESLGSDLLIFDYDAANNASSPVTVIRSSMQSLRHAPVHGRVVDFVTNNLSASYGFTAEGLIFALDFSVSPSNPGIQLIGQVPFLTDKSENFTIGAIELASSSTLIVSISYLTDPGVWRTDIFIFTIPAQPSTATPLTLRSTKTVAERVSGIAYDGVKYFYANSADSAKLFRFSI